MSKLNPEKLYVEYQTGVTETSPIIPRRYTLTHSDITAELFLSIGKDYDYDAITEMRDEVLGEWLETNGCYSFHVYLYIGGNYNQMVLSLRNEIFRRELPLALEAIRYGDDTFFGTYPDLDYAPIVVFFLCDSDSKYNTVEIWGSFRDYKI